MGKRRCGKGFGAVGWGDSLLNPAFTQMDLWGFGNGALSVAGGVAVFVMRTADSSAGRWQVICLSNAISIR